MRIARELVAQWGEVADSASLSASLIPARDYVGLSSQDEQLRIWLPDPAKVALIEICNRLGVSLTAYLTELFAVYLYGIHEVLRMRDNQTGLYDIEGAEIFVDCQAGDSDADDDDSAPFDEPVPEMGKNIFALKIFLPSKLKIGLQRRADRASVSLGRFARAMICAHLFGRDVGPNFLIAHNTGKP